MKDKNKKIFINAIKNSKIKILKILQKADMHQHSTISFDLNDFKKCMGGTSKVSNVSQLTKWIVKNIDSYIVSENNLKKILQSNFKRCVADGVNFVVTSIDYHVCSSLFNSDVKKFILFLKKVIAKFNINARFDVGISRFSFVKEDEILIMKMIDSKFFSGIDLYSVEKAQPNKIFVNVFKYNKSLGLINKAHIGEYSDAKSIIETIKELNLDEVQHGINIVYDKKCLKMAKKLKTVFNVCPTSNEILNAVKDFKNHPIKRMCKARLKLTIGTDDYAVLKANVSDEYLKLHLNKVLNAKQIYTINKFAIKHFKQFYGGGV